MNKQVADFKYESLGLGDPKRVLVLLAEYNDKLQDACKNRIRGSYEKRSSLIMSLLGCFVTSLIAIGAFFQAPSEWDLILKWIVVIGFALGAIILFFTFVENALSFDMSAYEADNLALVIEKLASLASQYRDHSHSFDDEHLEFELRMSEVEHTLALYNRVFNRNHSIANSAAAVSKALFRLLSIRIA